MEMSATFRIFTTHMNCNNSPLGVHSYSYQVFVVTIAT